MGWGSEVRGERVLEMSGAGLHVCHLHGSPKPVENMVEEDQGLFRFPQRMIHSSSRRTCKGQVQKWNLDRS